MWNGAQSRNSRLVGGQSLIGDIVSVTQSDEEVARCLQAVPLVDVVDLFDAYQELQHVIRQFHHFFIAQWVGYTGDYLAFVFAQSIGLSWLRGAIIDMLFHA